MRGLVSLAVAAVVALILLPLSSAPVSAVSLPVRQLASVAYFPPTGHHVQGEFLTFWATRGGLAIFGFPLTEEFEEGGLRVQYFERARFEFHPENPAPFRVQLGLLGHTVTAGRTGGAFTPIRLSQPYPNNDAHWYVPVTGHFISYGFKDFWLSHGALDIFGYPISEEFTENGYTVQYFERARFEWHPEHRGTPYEIQLGLLGSQVARARGINLAGVPQRPGSAVYPEISFLPAKWIEVDLSLPQRLTAWEGDRPVFSTSMSGGLARTPTPTGVFSVQWKLRYDDMTGGRAGTSDYYYLPDVPYVMYFYTGGYAIHGTYWHSSFGYPMSRGCVNLPISAAAWLWEWAPTGTPIWIHGSPNTWR
ncbi:MAG: L,D-transpeptidase [Sphaerobacter sp.]|nr:L,D-transpeptidase [Sphaerobacter sp.]